MAAFPCGVARLGARPWQREGYDRAYGWQAKLAERTQLFSRFTRTESTVAADVRQQSRLFAPRNQWLRPSPNSIRLC
jgi:hypothetical protein